VSVPLWVGEAAAAFWERAGGEEPFPRNLRGPIAYALPLGVVLLPRLRVAGVDDWLAAQGLPCAVSVRDRPLRACLVARHGQGFVFVDGTDPDDEQRFSLAHELAHFLRDYAHPRDRAVARLGPDILAVLDGLRLPTHAERIDAVLASVPLGVHVHLMDRTPDGHPPGVREDAAERQADLLALELLAPRAAVEAALAPPGPHAADRRAIVACLTATFGLPAAIATAYAGTLAPAAPAPSPFLRRLGLAP
jgi:hypothetical protein